MNKKNTQGLQNYTKEKNAQTIDKVNAAIDRLKLSNPANINFSTVAKEAGVSKATLYNNPVLKERILGLRTATKGVSQTNSDINQISRVNDKGYLETIRKLRRDKKNLILQLVEMEELRDENAKLREQLNRLCGGDGDLL